MDSAPGKGASFQIYLPRHTGEPALAEQKVDSGEKLCGSESILLVEDAEPLRKLEQTILEAGGFHVLPAGSGEEALEVAARFGSTFDLLVTDVVMPGMNGRTLAEQLSPRQPGMKVLFISGYTDSFIAGYRILDPAMHLLHKPFTEEVLIRKVREVLDGGKKPAPAMSQMAELAGSNIRSDR